MNNLTPRIRSHLTLLVGIAALLLLSIVVWAVTANGQGAGMQPIAWIALAAIGLSAFAAALLLIGSARSRQVAQLKPEYYRTFEQVVAWLQLSTLSQSEQAEVMRDVLGLLHDAQALGKPSADVAGDDPAEFVRRIQAAHGHRNTLIFWALDSLSTVAWMVPLTQVAVWLMRRSETAESTSFFSTPIGVAIVPYLLVLAFLVMPLTRIFLAQGRSGAALAMPLGLGLLFVITSKVLRGSASAQQWVRVFLDGEVVMVGSWLAVILWAALFGATVAARSQLRRASLRDLQR